MTKILAIIEDTFREAFSKFTFLTFFIFSNLVIAVLLFALNLDIVDGALAAARLFGQDLQFGEKRIDATQLIIQIQSILATLVYSLAIFLSIFATANLVPHMLERGTVDLILSKPLARCKILFAKYLGCLSIVAFNVAYLIAVSWLILSLKTGVWNVGFLSSGLVILFTFSILLCLVVLIGVLTRSSAMAIMLTYVVLFISSPLAVVHLGKLGASFSRVYPKAYYSLQALYWMLPKTFELGNITRVLSTGGHISSDQIYSVFGSSLLFGAAALGGAMVYFGRKDY